MSRAVTIALTLRQRSPFPWPPFMLESSSGHRVCRSLSELLCLCWCGISDDDFVSNFIVEFDPNQHAGERYPPAPTQSGIPSDCDAYAVTESGDGCYDSRRGNGITLAELCEFAIRTEKINQRVELM